MPYANETDRYKIPWWETGEISSGASNEDAALNIEWPLELINKIIAGEACDCTLGAGFQVSAGAGLSIDVAAGSGMIGGLAIYAGDITNKPSLPDDEATIYLYLKLTATTKRDRSFTVEASLSGPPLADAIYIATCTTAGGAVTVVNNSPADRTPRLPGSISGIPGLRIVAPAGAQYTDPKTAIEDCIAGDFVCICAGTYPLTETITLPADNITILGASRDAVILDNTTGSAETVLNLNTKNGIRLSNFSIRTAAGNTGRAITGDACADTLIEGVKIVSTALSYGIYLAGPADSRVCIRDCDFTGSMSTHALRLATFSYGRVVGNTIQNAGAGGGIYIASTDNILIAHNLILLSLNATTGGGVYLLAVNRSRLVSNIIQASSAPGTWSGITHYGNVGTVVGNIFVNNVLQSIGDVGLGITLVTNASHYIDESVIAGNIILDFATAVSLADVRVRETLVHGNKVATCTTGVTDAGTNTNALDQD